MELAIGIVIGVALSSVFGFVAQFMPVKAKPQYRRSSK